MAPWVASEEADWPAWAAVGDVRPGQAVLVSQNRAGGSMEVIWSDGKASRRVRGPEASARTGWTSRITLDGLPAGQTIDYEVRFSTSSLRGRFRTPPAGSGVPIRFAWSGDVCGQGWGIDESRGGMQSFATLARLEPDFFVHCGDSVYADDPLPAQRTMADGSLWRNRLIPEKTRAAISLDDFRGQYRYNLLDVHYRQFLARVPVVAQWDDHEVLNNWDEAHHQAWSSPARQAFLEYWPVSGPQVYRKISYGPDLDLFVLDLRSYRAPNSHNRQSQPGPETVMLGKQQLEWLKKGLSSSRANWKFIAGEMPIGTYDERFGLDNWGNGPGGPLGREWELADLLSFLKNHRVQNVVWLCADVHYAAALHYDPSRAVFKDFDPFWEFIAGPLHAGTFPSQKHPLDPTFGPRMVYDSVTPALKNNRPPSEGLQFFGQVHILGKHCQVSLHRQDGTSLFSQTL